MLVANPTLKLTNQVEAIVHFIKEMDIEMIDAFLDDRITYQNMKKYLFVSKLQSAFKEFQSSGDVKLASHPGNCNGCNKACSGFSFLGNHSRNYMDLVVVSEGGRIKDLYECANFKISGRALKKKERIMIDDFPF